MTGCHQCSHNHAHGNKSEDGLPTQLLSVCSAQSCPTGGEEMWRWTSTHDDQAVCRPRVPFPHRHASEGRGAWILEVGTARTRVATFG